MNKKCPICCERFNTYDARQSACGISCAGALRSQTVRSSKYRGVSRIARKEKPWRAQIYKGNKRVLHIGVYATEREAALEYDRVARQYGKPEHLLNFPRSGSSASSKQKAR